MKKLILSVIALCATVVMAGQGAGDFTWDETGDIVPGKWNSQYAKAIAYAKEHDCPIVGFWANPGCGHCNKLEKALGGNKTFEKWAAERGYVLLFGYGTSGEGSKTKSYCSDVSGQFPYIGLSWNGREIGTASGSVHKKGTVGSDYRLTFSGRSSYMPGTGSDLATKFMDSCDKYLSGYVNNPSSAFTASNTACNRMECEANSSNKVTIAVGLQRESATSALTEKLTVTYPSASSAAQTNVVTWAADQSNQNVAVTLDLRKFTADGQQAILSILDKNGAVAATNAVTYVEKETSAANPKWIGETFGFGEWTCDIDGAKKLAQKKGGYTLVSIQGSLWCHDCANTDRNFLDLVDDKGNNRFAAWAKAHNVALVSMDIPNYQGPTVADRATPTLFSTDAYATTLAYEMSAYGYYDVSKGGADPSLTNAIVRSGLGYLTRKGVSADAAEAMLNKFHDFACNNTDKGGFHRPEDKNANRTGVPIFVLLRTDGTVAARFTRFASTSPMVADRANFEHIIKRFDEMLSLAANDATEIENNYPATTNALAVVANGGTLTSTLCHADFQDAVRLSGLTGGAEQQIAITGTSAAEVKAQVYMQDAEGKVSTVGNARTGALSAGLKWDVSPRASGNYFVLIEGKDITSEEFKADNTNADNFVTYTVTGETTYVPTDVAATGIAREDGSVKIELEKDRIYYITPLDVGSCADVLEVQPGTDNLIFKSLVSGKTNLTVRVGATDRSFTYQLWQPGTVGFAETAKTVEESINDLNDDWVLIDVARVGGRSGAVKVRVAVDTEKTTLASKRYEFTQTDLVWPDGVNSNMQVRVKVIDDNDIQDDEVLTLKMEVLAGAAWGSEITEGKGSFALTVVEDDKTNPGKAMITYTEPTFAKGTTLYTRASDGAWIWLERIDGSNGLASVDIESSRAGLTYAMENPRDLEVTEEHVRVYWSSREMTNKYVKVTGMEAGQQAKLTIKASSDNFEVVKDASSVTIVALEDDAPAFETSAISDTMMRYAAYSRFVRIDRIDRPATKVSFKKLSGSLPAGIKVSYSYSSTDQGMLISGVPTATDTKSGIKTFTAVYQVVGDGVKGTTIELTFTVFDPVMTDSEGSGEPYNDAFAKTRTYTDMLILDLSSGRLFGTLTLTIPRTGKASGKLTCPYGKLAFSTKSWSGMGNPAEGALKLSLACTTKNFTYLSLDVIADNTGALEVACSGLSGDTWTLASGEPWSATHTAEDYEGIYTVAMPTNGILYGDADVAALGTPTLTLKMSSASQFKSGKMTWAGTLPNGKSVSGSAVLTEAVKREGIVYLPILYRSNTDVFGAVASITNVAQAEAQISSNCYRSVVAPTFENDGMQYPQTLPYWIHTSDATKTNAVEYAIEYQLYGSIYNLAKGLDCCCKEQVDSTNLTLNVRGVAASPYYDAVGPVEPVVLNVSQKSITLAKGQDNPQKVSFKLGSNGSVSGSFKLPYEDANGNVKTLTAKYKGVVLIGWGSACGCSDIDLPFIQGAWYFDDKVQYEGSTKWVKTVRGSAVETSTTSRPNN